MGNDHRDAYEGAREDLLDWKRRAQVAEAQVRELETAFLKGSEIIGRANTKIAALESRLAAGDPVAWQFRFTHEDGIGDWQTTADKRTIEVYKAREQGRPEIRPLYIAQQPAAQVPGGYTKEWCERMARLEGNLSITAGNHAKPLEPACTLPPDGWYCTRQPGHDGPCAALAIPPAAQVPDEPVAWRSRHVNYVGWTLSEWELPMREGQEQQPLYLDRRCAAIPDSLHMRDVTHPKATNPEEAWMYATGWNACRAAMLATHKESK